MLNSMMTVALFVSSAALNVCGVALQRYAVANDSVVAAVAGCLCWAATSVVFLMLLEQKHALIVASVVTSALGFLAVFAIGLAFGEAVTTRQLMGVGLLILGMILLSLSAA